MMMKSGLFKYTALALTIFLLSCSSNRSLVVLLPDPDGKVGQIEVTTDKGAQRVGQAYHSIQTGARDDAPSAPAPMEQKKIMRPLRSSIGGAARSKIQTLDRHLILQERVGGAC